MLTLLYLSVLVIAYISILSDMNTGKIIADLREARGWSQTDLASKSSVSRVMIASTNGARPYLPLKLPRKLPMPSM